MAYDQSLYQRHSYDIILKRLLNADRCEFIGRSLYGDVNLFYLNDGSKVVVKISDLQYAIDKISIT